MKVQNVAVDEIERIGINTNQAFTIKFDAKMAKILADGLYSDKIQSVIRELSCNAWDSHVEAGHADQPFDVHLPSTIEPWFSIRDYGVGLEHDDVISIYTCYGASTKTNSNDVIGQLGLGSKSPFSLCNAFDVSSRRNGVENHYSMYKDELGMPSVAHLGSCATTEPNGVTVKIPVNADQRREFGDKAREVYKWFPVKPRMIGTNISFETIKYEYTGNKWGVRKPQTDYYGYADAYKSFALMGMVAYPLDSNAIANLTNTQRVMMRLPLVLNFDIGDLEVAANREALGYDERTCNNIRARLDTMIAELGEKFEKEIASAPTLWQAKKSFDRIFGYHNGNNHVFRDVFASHGLKWGKTVIKSGNHKIDLDTLYGKHLVNDIKVWSTHVYTFSSRYKSGRRVHDSQLMIDCDDNTVIMFDDVRLGGVSRAKEYHNEHNHNKNIVLFKESDTVKWADIQKALGDPEVIYTSTLPKPVRKTATERTNILRWRDTHNESSMKAWEQVSIDIEEGGFYVDLKIWDIQALGRSYKHMGQILSQARAANIIDADTQVYAMRAENKRIVSDDPNWVELYSYIKNEVEKAVRAENLAQHIADAEEYHRVTSQTRWHFWKHSYSNDQGVMATFAKEMAEIAQEVTVKNSRVEALKSLAVFFEINLGTAKPRYALHAGMVRVMATYPMLSFNRDTWYNINERDIKKAIEYVNYVDITLPFYNITMSETVKAA